MGIGQWGCAQLCTLPSGLVEMANLIGAHSDISELAACPVRTLVWIEEEGGVPTVKLDPDSGASRLREATIGSDLVILLSNPEDSRFSEISANFESWCLTQGILTRSVVFPASKNGALHRGRVSVGECLAIDLAVRTASEIPRLVQTLCYAICGVILKSGSISVDFADVRTVLEERGRSSAAMGTAHGAGRAQSACMAALHSTPEFIRQVVSAQAVLALLISKDDPGLDEFSEVGDMLSRYLPPESTVVMGVVVNPEMREADMELLVLVTSLDDTQPLFN